MMTATTTLTPLVEAECPRCLHRAPRPAKRFQLVRLASPEEAYPLAWAMQDRYAMRCRCGHAWITSLVVGVALEGETSA